MPLKPGWDKSGTLFSVAHPDGNGKRLIVGRKKIEKLRALLPGKSTPEIARFHLETKLKKPKEPKPPKTPTAKAPKPKAPKIDGWNGKGATYIAHRNGKKTRIAAKFMNRVRAVPGHAPLSNASIAQLVMNSKQARKGGAGYNALSDTYKYVDVAGTVHDVKGAPVRAALTRFPDIDGAVRHAYLSTRKEKGIYAARDEYVTTLNGTLAAKRTFKYSIVKALRDRLGVNRSLDDGAREYLRIEASKPAHGTSAWHTNLKNLGRKYWFWTGKHHEKIPESELMTFAGNTNDEKASRALANRKAGWTADKSAYFVVNQQRFVRIGKNAMTRIKAQLTKLGKPSNDANAAFSWLRSMRYRRGNFPENRRGNRGFVNFKADTYVTSAGNVVPKFMNRYPANANNNSKTGNSVSGVRTSIRDAIVGDSLRNAMIGAATDARKSRDALDDSFMCGLPQASSLQFKTYLVNLFKQGGELKNRHGLPGNVGTPGDSRSAYDQLQDLAGNRKFDGCKLLAKQWPGGLGGSLQIHQGVVFAMANLRARDKIQTPGLIALHSTGAGKTIECLSAVVAFWNKTFGREKKPWGIFPASTRSNQDKNNIDRFAIDATRFFSWFKSEYKGHIEYPFSRGVKHARTAIAERLRAGHRALGFANAVVPDAHLVGSYGTLAHNFYGPTATIRKTSDGKFRYCVFIADEIQLLFDPTSAEKALADREYADVRRLFTVDRARADSWVMALTATPGETFQETSRVLECIDGQKGRFGTSHAMEKNAAGLVSYAFTQGDLSKYPRIHVQQECIDVWKASDAASGMYASRYAHALSRLEETANLPELMNKFNGSEKKRKILVAAPHHIVYNNSRKSAYWSRVRQKSEWLRVSGNEDLHIIEENNSNNENDAKQKKKKKKTIRNSSYGVNYVQNETSLMRESQRTYSPIVRAQQIPGSNFFYILSPKLVQTITNIMNPQHQGVHYVYSADWMTLRLIAWVLASRFGFSQYMRGDTTPRPRFGFVDSYKSELKTKFYGKLMKSPSSGEYTFGGRTVKSTRENPISSDGWMYSSPMLSVSKQDTSALAELMRTDANSNGDLVKVVLATRDSFKGIDVYYIRHLHLISSLVNYGDLIQFIGRGTRACGHKSLPLSQRKLAVHLYKLTAGERGCYAGANRKLLPDCYIFDEALRRFRAGWQNVEEIMMRASVDYELFKSTFNRASRQIHEDIAKDCSVDVPTPRLETIKKFIGGDGGTKAATRERKRLRQIAVANKIRQRRASVTSG